MNIHEGELKKNIGTRLLQPAQVQDLMGSHL